ncbi:hypothetical protein [Rhizobium sp. CSW-27]|uniref:hypothetical protein n=1 Tax=Rhizobium sp. CSW-27 TaxID=2839985 RepID=UPI001C0123BF|nr:hypothetical protein [Rhizobium sp. CSW-27]MBT9369400.1 hypothetical protein [Rhizobium sp. CSW-27]
MPTKDRTASTMTTAPTSQTMLFMMISLAWGEGPRSACRALCEADEVEDGDDDDDGSHEPDDAVHFQAPWLFRSINGAACERFRLPALEPLMDQAVGPEVRLVSDPRQGRECR